MAKQLSQKSQQDSNVVNQLKAIVADREAKVKVLEQELVQLRNNHYQVCKRVSCGMGALVFMTGGLAVLLAVKRKSVLCLSVFFGYY